MNDLPFTISELQSIIPNTQMGRHGWVWVTVPSRVYYCPFHLVLAERATGRPVVLDVPCGSWAHETCALDKATDHVEWFMHLFDRYERIWVAWCDYEPTLPARLRQRRQACNGDYVWVRRNRGRVYVFSDSDLGGRVPPVNGLWVRPQSGILLATLVAFRLPGLAEQKAVNYSKGWRRSRSGTGRFGKVWFGGHDVDMDRAYRLAALIIEQRHGVTMPRYPWDYDDKLPDGVPFDEWVEVLNTSLDTVKQTSRMPQRGIPGNLTLTAEEEE